MRPAVTETAVDILLPGGPLRVTVRRTARARGLRVTIHAERGVIVSLPPATRRGWTHADEHVERFLRDRERWIRRHLAANAAQRAALHERPGLGAGRLIPYLGRPHRVIVAADAGSPGRSRITPLDLASGPALVVELGASERRAVAAVLDGWFRERARAAIASSIARHAPALGVAPAAVTLRDPRSRWGSCSRAGRISLSWRLILAPPEALDSVVVHELCHLRVFGHGPRFRSLLGSRIPGHATWRRWLHVHGPDLHAALDPSGAESAAA